jgi:CTP:molybdopterin cytidylyltransferase MocA
MASVMGRRIVAHVGRGLLRGAGSIRPVTVAAVILAASAESALAVADGQARVRRIADAAWAGGALPVVVVAADPTGAVALALAGAPVTLAEPAPPAGGPPAQIARGLELARREVDGVEAALVWPARVCWVGPETVTTLIEASGRAAGTVIRPAFEGKTGWPVLVPQAAVTTIAGLDPSTLPDAIVEALVAVLPARVVEVGDPGVTHDASVARGDLPPYAGPPEPGPEHRREWGSPAADTPDEAPVTGPALAPYDPSPDADA